MTIPAFKVVSVFDVSQTEGKELPDIAVDALTGNVAQYEDFWRALKLTSPVPVTLEKIDGSAHGYYDLAEKRIAIDDGMSELQTIKTAIHEVAHAKLHDIDLNAPEPGGAPRPQHPRGAGGKRCLYGVPAFRAGHVGLLIWLRRRVEQRPRY